MSKTPSSVRNCPSDDDLAAHLEGRLPDPASAGIEAHLRDCERCHVVMIALGFTPETPGEDGSPEEAFAPILEMISRARPTTPSTLGTGCQFGSYEILGSLGRGGMGVVYHARDVRSGAEVALKLLSPLTRKEENVDADLRLRREAKVLGRLGHPNLVAIRDAGVHDGRRYVAMELVDGRTLTAWLGEQARAWHDVVGVFLDLARGLAAAHTVGIVHRDLKPANILIDRLGRAKLTDFGLARSIRTSPGDANEEASSRVTRPGRVTGTAPYMSPEHLRGKPVDGRSDQFSYFICLHEALTGQRPFGGASFADAGTAIVLGHRVRPPSLATLPPALRHGIERGLAHRPEFRFRSMDEVERALTEVLRRPYPDRT
jgi:serine/threonine protein kinase